MHSAAARPSRSPGSRGASGLSWARGLGGAGKDLVLDLVPCAPPSPEPERPHSCSGVQGVASFLHCAEGCLLEKARCFREPSKLGQVWEGFWRHALSSGAEASHPGATEPPELDLSELLSDTPLGVPASLVGRSISHGSEVPAP